MTSLVVVLSLTLFLDSLIAWLFTIINSAVAVLTDSLVVVLSLTLFLDSLVGWLFTIISSAVAVLSDVLCYLCEGM